MNIKNNLTPVTNIFEKSNEIKTHLEENYRALLNDYLPIYNLKKCKNSNNSDEFYLQIVFTELQSRKFIPKHLPTEPQRHLKQDDEPILRPHPYLTLNGFIDRNFRRDGNIPRSTYFEKAVKLLNFFYTYSTEDKNDLLKDWEEYNRDNKSFLKNFYKNYFEKSIRTNNDGTYYYLSEYETINRGRKTGQILKINDDYYLVQSIFSYIISTNLLSDSTVRTKITIRTTSKEETIDLDEIDIERDKIDIQYRKLQFLSELFDYTINDQDKKRILNEFLNRNDLKEFDYHIVAEFHSLFYLPFYDKRKHNSKLVNIGYLKDFGKYLKKMSRESKIRVEEFPLFNDSMISTHITCKKSKLCDTESQYNYIDNIYYYTKKLIDNFFTSKLFFMNIPINSLNSLASLNSLTSLISSSYSTVKNLFSKGPKLQKKKLNQIYLDYINHMIIAYLVYELYRPVYTINIIFRKRDQDFQELGPFIGDDNTIDEGQLLTQVNLLNTQIINFLGLNPITIEKRQRENALHISFGKDLNNVIDLKSFFSKILDLYDHQDKKYDVNIAKSLDKIIKQRDRRNDQQRSRVSSNFRDKLWNSVRTTGLFTNKLKEKIREVIKNFEYIYEDDVKRISQEINNFVSNLNQNNTQQTISQEINNFVSNLSQNNTQPATIIPRQPPRDYFVNYLQQHDTIEIRNRIWKMVEKEEDITFEIYFGKELKHPKKKAQYKSRSQVEIGNHINDTSFRKTTQDATTVDHQNIRFIKKTDFYRNLTSERKRQIREYLKPKTFGNIDGIFHIGLNIPNDIQSLLKNDYLLSNLEKSRLKVELNQMLNEKVLKQRRALTQEQRNKNATQRRELQQAQRQQRRRNFLENLPDFIE